MDAFAYILNWRIVFESFLLITGKFQNAPPFNCQVRFPQSSSFTELYYGCRQVQCLKICAYFITFIKEMKTCLHYCIVALLKLFHVVSICNLLRIAPEESTPFWHVRTTLTFMHDLNHPFLIPVAAISGVVMPKLSNEQSTFAIA